MPRRHISLTYQYWILKEIADLKHEENERIKYGKKTKMEKRVISLFQGKRKQLNTLFALDKATIGLAKYVKLHYLLKLFFNKNAQMLASS